jgi:hypothetical protein
MNEWLSRLNSVETYKPKEDVITPKIILQAHPWELHQITWKTSTQQEENSASEHKEQQAQTNIFRWRDDKWNGIDMLLVTWLWPYMTESCSKTED